METRIYRTSSSRTAALISNKLLSVYLILLLLLLLGLLPPVTLAGPLYIDCDPCIERSHYEIRAIVHGTKDDFMWQQVQAAMTQAARDMGVDFSIQLRDVGSNVSETMVQDIYDTIRYEFDDSEHGHTHDVKQVDALIVTIPDDAVAAAVQEAAAANIHVFGFHQGYDQLVAREPYLLGFVAQDEYLAGQFAAEAFLQRQDRLLPDGSDGNDQMRRALYLNHDGSSGALRERFRGFNETLFEAAGIEAEELIVDPDHLYDMIVTVHQEFEACRYDFVLLAGNQSLVAAREAFGHYGCGGEEQQQVITTQTQGGVDNNSYTFQINERDAEIFNATMPLRNNRRMIMGAFDQTPEIIDAIAQDQLEFTFTQQIYLQSVLPVIMATIYATTGAKLALPSDDLVYFSGPQLVDKMNLPTKSFLTCQTEAFPVCPNQLDPQGNPATCPCTDRTKLRIAGVVHGLKGDPFWDTVFSAARQASHEMEVELIMDRIDDQQNDALVHHLMTTQIRNLCSSGIDGIFVSIPSEKVKSAVRFCQSLNIPVVSINTGEKFAKELGIQFIGQVEYVAGQRAAERLIQAGMEEGYCLRHEVSTSLNQRCLGFADYIESTGGNVTFGGIVTIPHNVADYRSILEDVVGQEGNWKGVAFVVSGPIQPALNVQWFHQSAIISAFDVKNEIFGPLDSGRVLFTIDQQQYLQGSMPVYLLTYAAYTKQALLNTVIETGPKLMEYSPSDAFQTCEKTGYEICSFLPEENYNYIGPFLRIWGYVGVGLVGVAALGSLLWTFINRGTKPVRSSNPFFLGVLVVGVLVSTASIIPFGAETEYRYVKDSWTGKMTTQKDPNIQLVDAACMLGPWCYGVGFAIAFSALCGKISSVQRRKKMEVTDVMSFMAATVLIEVAILLSWTLFSPLKWHRMAEEEIDGYVVESTGECTSDNGPYFFVGQVGFHILCLLYALAVSWQSREMPSEFAEGSWVSMAVVCVFQVSVLAIPIGWMTKDYPDAHYLFRVAAIFLQNFTVLCLIFGPKMLGITRGNDQLPISTVGGRANMDTGNSGKRPPLAAIGKNIDTGNSGQRPGHPALEKNGVGSDKNTPLQAPTGSDSDTDESEKEKAPYPGHKKNQARESAPIDRMASLDSDSDSDSEESPMKDMENGYKGRLSSNSSSSSVSPAADITEDVNADLADLAAEISRAQETRKQVYASAMGEDAPPLADAEGPDLVSSPDDFEQRARAMSFTSTPTATPSDERSLEAPNVTFCHTQDSTEDDSDSSSEHGEVMHVAAETQSPKKDFRRMDSDDDESESSSVRRRIAAKKPFTPDIGILDGSASNFNNAAQADKPTMGEQSQPQSQLQQQDFPGVGVSGPSSPDNEGAQKSIPMAAHSVPISDEGSPKRRFERRGSPDIDDSEPSSSSEYEGKRGLNYEKNPQEGSLVSHENGSDNRSHKALKLPTPPSRLMGDHNDPGSASASTSTGPSAQGISHSEAAKAEIFRKPSDIPIRLKKPASQYGDLTALATGLTKTSGSFLRKVAASYGSGSLDAASSSRPLSSFGTINKENSNVANGMLETADHEFDVNRQSRPHYQEFKNSTGASKAEGQLRDSEKSMEAKKCDGEVLYFS